jgi:hypothetical protein
MKNEISPESTNTPINADNMRAEYDFSGGVRGKYAKDMREHGYTIRVEDANGAYTERTVPGERVVVLEPDVFAYFPDSEAVNKALRAIIPAMPRRTAP